MATSVTLKPNAIDISGSTSGTTTLQASAVAGTTTLTLPAATDTLVGKATTDTLTNKTLTGAAMNGTLGATTPSTASVTTLTTSSTVTHSGGTANGVAYLDGSKVLTTGSALVFNGTNLGVGVTPSAWDSTYKAMEIGRVGNTIAGYNGGTEINVVANAYYSGGWKYAVTGGLATRYASDNDGKHYWYNAPSGTAGNAITFTQAMTLDASNNWYLGTTTNLLSSANRVTMSVNGTSSAALAFGAGGTRTAHIYADSAELAIANASGASGYIDFQTNGSERCRITSGGDLLVGTTSNLSSRFGVQGATNADYAIYCQNSSASVLFGTRNDGLFFTGTTTNAPYNFATSGGKALYVNSSGQIGYNSSLREHKTNIVQAPSVDWLDQLNVVSFNYRKRSDDGVYTEEAQGETLWGVIADDAVAVKPDFCSYDSKGNLDGFHYDRLIAPLLKRVQEQQDLITQLTARITALESA
jgi:hypothetical protein